MYNQDAAEALKGDKGGGEMGRRGEKRRMRAAGVEGQAG